MRWSQHRTRRASRAGRVITETLEGRILFANRIWDGGAGASDPNWSNAVNWQGNNAPVAGDTLFFPVSVTQRTALNDFEAGTEFSGINIDGSGSYAISGNAIEMGTGGINVSGSASHTFNLPVTLGNTGRSVTVTDLASLSMSGPFTGNGALNKNANGTLELTSDSPQFDGAVNVNAGTLRVNSPLALGSTDGQTFVVNFATLRVGAGAGGSAEGVFISGEGDDEQGAFHAEGAATWDGDVQVIGGDAVVVIDGGDFTLAGDFERGATGSGVIKQGAGRMILSGRAGAGLDLTIDAGAARWSGLNPSFDDVVVANGATLELSGGRNATVDSLSIRGTGAGAGALVNVSGNNSIAGQVTLADSATIGATGGTLTLRGNINTGTANPARTLTFAGAGNVVVGGANGTGAITGNGSITKTGNGTLTLSGSGNNTYTGATNVSQGTLVARKASALGAPSAGTVVSNNASLQLDGGVTLSAEPLTINGNGVSSGGALGNVAGSNTFSGNVTLGSAARIASTAGTLTVTGNIDTTANAHTLTASGAGTVDFGGAGVLSGAGRLNKEGTGTLVLSGGGVNTYTGITQVFNGVIRVRKNSAFGSTAAETVTAGPGTVELFSSNNFNIIQGVTVAERIRISTGGFNGLGALSNASGRNTWSGPVEVVNPAAVGSTSGTLLISGTITGTQPLSKFGAGGVALSGNNANFTGRISVQAGSLNVRSANALGASGANSSTEVSQGATLSLGNAGFNGIQGVNVANETLQLLGGATLTASSAFGNGPSTWGGPVILNGLAARTINAASSLTISGVISGTAALTKSGSRTLTLTGNNTFTGATTVASGRLLLNNTLNSAVTVNSGAEMAGTGTIRSLDVQGGGVVSPGADGPGILTVTNGLTLRAGSTLRVDLNGTTPGTQHDQLRVTGGTVTLADARQRNGRIIRPRLEGTLGFNPATGDQFHIIDNAGNGATTGRFSATSVTIGEALFSVATVGNDVVLTRA